MKINYTERQKLAYRAARKSPRIEDRKRLSQYGVVKLGGERFSN